MANPNEKPNKSNAFTLSSGVEENHQFITPSKGVKGPQDMTIWENSVAYFDYLSFILAVNDAVKSKPIVLGAEPISPVTSKLIDMFGKLEDMVKTTPPAEQPQRFGNVAFRTWWETLREIALDLLKEVLPFNLHRAIPEIMIYLIESFGNSTRIDYGTGHEISFLLFMCCMFKIGALEDNDKADVALQIFPRYLELVRNLQRTYRMEPAGSHGVWSLDDYQFVPFIWGSSQLINHPRIEPTSFLHDDVVQRYHREYLFMGCIRYITSVKTGPFAEHSNQLWGISAVSTWSKVNAGLIKMYKAEVLGKFPVVQHIQFGSLLPLKPAQPQQRNKNYSGGVVS